MQKAERKPTISLDSPIMMIDAEKEFNQLTPQEKNYSYHIYMADWNGTKITYFQNSYESPAIFTLLQLVFSGQTTQELREACTKNGLTEIEVNNIFAYAAGFFTNCGSYLSFGHKKFVPDTEPEKFHQLIQLSQNYQTNKKLMDELWNEVKFYIYVYTDPFGKLGFPRVSG